MKRRLLFLHVQKTGGSTLTGAVSNRFAAAETLQLYYFPEPDLSNLGAFRYITGHVPLSFVGRLDESPFVFTFLRDPVERALSAYSFIRTRPPAFARQPLLVGRGPDAYERLEECMRLARESTLEHMIARAPEIATEYFGNRQARALGSFPPEGGEERLEEALAGLESCDFVGLTERLDESTAWLMRRLGWSELTPLPRINVTGARLTREQVSPEGLEALRELTAVDLELYQHGVERYERQLAEWHELSDPRDPSAEIADAAASTDLRFGDAIRGAGWVGRELIGDDPAFCWMGDANRAWVDLATDRRANSVVIEFPHVLDQAILESLRISVDGRTVPHQLAEANGAVTATARLRRRILPARGGMIRITLEVDRTTRPCDVDPMSSDDRELSLGVRRIALESA
jgi:hypothetical protein